jgi:hypothetical protein
MRTWNAEIELNSSTRGKRHYIPTKNHMSTTNQSPTYYTSLANPQQKQSNPPRPQPRISKQAHAREDEDEQRRTSSTGRGSACWLSVSGVWAGRGGSLSLGLGPTGSCCLKEEENEASAAHCFWLKACSGRAPVGPLPKSEVWRLVGFRARGARWWCHNVWTAAPGGARVA